MIIINTDNIKMLSILKIYFHKFLRFVGIANKVNAFKENGLWYISDQNGFSKEDNLLVEGVPELIERIVGIDVFNIEIKYSKKYFPGSLKLQLVNTDYIGSTYEYSIRDQSARCWLCSVFFWYFKIAPDMLFIEIKKSSK
jgi:hypothetical protein